MEEKAQEMMNNMTPEQALQVAKVEMEMMSTFFDNMVSHCFKKCATKLAYNINAPDYRGGELTIRELSCTDRCIQKYLQSQEITKKRMEKMDEMKAKQMEITMQAQQKIDNISKKFS